MSIATDRIPFDLGIGQPERLLNRDDHDLPFPPSSAGTGTAPPCPDDDPIYVGGVDAGQHGVFGPISLELLITDRDCIELGPFVLPRQQAHRLWRMLGVAVGLLDATPAPESGRGIAGWDLARNTDGLAHGVPWEGESLP